MSDCLKPDFHIHSDFSDGSDSVEEIVNNVRRAGLDAFSLTDHDAVDGCREIKKFLRDDDAFFINGVEVSSENEYGKFHILGYCFDENKKSVLDVVDFTHSVRMEKAEMRFNFLEEEYGFTFTGEEKKNIISLKNPGKPHFVNLLIKKGFVHDKKQGFEILSKLRTPHKVLTPSEAIGAISDAGGIPVLAHGILGDGSTVLSEKEITQCVEEMKNDGLMGLECFYSAFSENQKETMLSLAKKYNLLVTAGSDYHGKNKTIRLGDTNSPDNNIMKNFYKAIGLIK